MTDPAIQVRHLGKHYRTGERAKYRTLRDALSGAIASPFNSVFRRRSTSSAPSHSPSIDDSDHIWALQDVSFDVGAGELIGIIGRNGAGKSTLLRILSRITEPTTGYAAVWGRVGSLLEVGTGFHPELTGRENILLNGAILGIRKHELQKSFDDIVEFAEVERFIHTPVKYYSSGMYMRLAFAVAAHLQPDIMMVDEVLAVGDIAFQKKCLGKMDEVADSGRTVIFVSHNMTAIETLCERVIWLDKGQVREDGDASTTVSHYLNESFSALTSRYWDDTAAAPGNDDVRLRRACVRPLDGVESDAISVRTPFVLEFEYWNLNPGARLNLSINIFNEQGILVCNPGSTMESGWQGKPFELGLYRDVCYVPGDLFNDGMHRVELLVIQDMEHVVHKEEDILIFDVRDSFELRDGWHGDWHGAMRPMFPWTTTLVNEDVPLTLPSLVEAGLGR